MSDNDLVPMNPIAVKLVTFLGTQQWGFFEPKFYGRARITSQPTMFDCVLERTAVDRAVGHRERKDMTTKDVDVDRYVSVELVQKRRLEDPVGMGHQRVDGVEFAAGGAPHGRLHPDGVVDGRSEGGADGVDHRRRRAARRRPVPAPAHVLGADAEGQRLRRSRHARPPPNFDDLSRLISGSVSISEVFTRIEWLFLGCTGFFFSGVDLVSCRFVKVSLGWNDSFRVLLGFAEWYRVLMDLQRVSSIRRFHGSLGFV